MDKIKEFFTETKTGRHIYSFLKTYVVVFLGIYYYGVNEQGKDLFDLVFIGDTSKIALASVLRNIFKLITEKNAR